VRSGQVRERRIEGHVVRRRVERDPGEGPRGLPGHGEIQEDRRVALLFHSLSDDTQVRVQAEASIHHRDELAEKAWQELAPRRRRDYLVSGPRGLPWAWATSGLPSELEARDPSEAESEAGRLNFAVVVCHVRQMDWLFLTPYGHRRANFAWNGDGKLQTSWLVP